MAHYPALTTAPTFRHVVESVTLSGGDPIIETQHGEWAAQVRVRYAETDQMGVAHHANYLIWCELARTYFMEQQGVRYRDLEADGVRLPVVRADLRFRAPARYDDELRVRCWVRDCRGRVVQFGNAIERVTDDVLLATAQITLIAIDSGHRAITIPAAVREKLLPIPDPVRL